jgi:AAHS family 4-hydroxybenzoate transporter-like MFS transporter
VRLDPRHEFSAETSFVVSEKKEAGSPIAALFRDGRARMTLLLWIMFFTNMLALFFVNSWLPTVLHSVGFGEGLAVGLTAVVHVGGILGGLVIAWLCDRLGRGQFYILAVAYASGGISIAALGFGGNWVVLVAIAVFMAGFFTFGVQNTANAVAATIYPGSMRSTGAGWAIGIGNSAQIVAPLFGGVLLSLQWTPSDILYVTALPPGMAAVAAMAIAMTTRRYGSHSVAGTDSASS